MATNSGVTEETIAQVAKTLVAAYKWQVVTVAYVVQQVMAKIAAGADVEGKYAIERLCMQAAAAQLYAAYVKSAPPSAGEQDQQLRQVVFQDLANYLDGMIQRMKGRLAPDTTGEQLVQEVLVTLNRQVVSCREPQSFLGFLVKILDRSRIASWRTLNRRTKRENSLDASADQIQAHTMSDAEGDDEVYSILGDCVDDDRQRIIALGVCLGLKRRTLLLLLRDMNGVDYDNLRRALIKRLFDCESFQEFLSNRWRMINTART